ncbi:signal peptidase I [bacterium]|nr:signal peptidase I [bacterium]
MIPLAWWRNFVHKFYYGLAVAFARKEIAKEKAQEWLKGSGDFLESIALAVGVVVAVVNPFVIQAFLIPSSSMIPTLQVGDRIMADKFVYYIRDPQRGEVIVFRAPPQADTLQRNFVKRVIGLPGDVIEVKDGRVYVNGKPLKEPYIYEPPYYQFGPYKVPKGYYFVMGDNRNDSSDSHIWGPLSRKRITGRALFIWWPVRRWGIVR